MCVLEDNGRKEPIYNRNRRHKMPSNKFYCPSIYKEKNTTRGYKTWINGKTSGYGMGRFIQRCQVSLK